MTRRPPQRRQVERAPVRRLRPQHDAEVEGVVGDEGEAVEGVVVARAVVDDLDGGRDRGDRGRHGVPRVSPTGEVGGQAHRDLGLDADAHVVGGPEGDRTPVDVRLVDPARARVIDAGEPLHDGGGEGHLPSRERTEPVLLVERLKAILDCVRLVDIARAEILRQAGEPLPRPVLFEETSCRGGGALPVDHRPTPLAFLNDARTGGQPAPGLSGP